MKYCIFLCDHQWNIVKIMDSSPTCPLSEGARLPELLENPELLQQRQKAGKKVFPISVNVARGDLYQKDLQQTLQSLLQKYELSAAPGSDGAGLCP